MLFERVRVAVFDPVVWVVIAVDVDVVVRSAVGLLERRRGVGEGSLEDGAQFGGERCEQLAGQELRREQGRFAAGDKADLPAWAPW